MPGKIIKVATGKQSLSVVGECIVGNVKDKTHRQSALLFWVGLPKNRESRRQRFVDEEEAPNWDVTHSRPD